VFLDGGEEVLEVGTVVVVGIYELGDDGPALLGCILAL